MPQYKGKVPFPDSMLFGRGRGSNIQALVLIVSIAVVVIIVEIGWRSQLRPLPEDLLLARVQELLAFFYEPLKYVTQFRSTLLDNSVKYPNAGSAPYFH